MKVHGNVGIVGQHYVLLFKLYGHLKLLIVIDITDVIVVHRHHLLMMMIVMVQ
jgi:hypothetical protein